MEITKYVEERETIFRSTQNPETQADSERQDDDDGEEVLSLCDLPLFHNQSTQDNEQHTTPCTPFQAQDDFQLDFDFDFDFCFPSEQSQISAADEIFFQGQILPFRRCITSTNRFLRHNSVLGRSSSHRSSTSSCSGSSAAATDPKQPPRNQFHSHPSPSPRILLRKNKQIITNNNTNCVKKSWSWSVFRPGLIAAQPETSFRDLKTRCSIKNSGGGPNNNISSEKKSNRAWDLVGGCKCSIDDAVPRGIAFMKRSASDGERSMNKPMDHRTYEWLKQLSLQGAAAAER